MEQPDVTAFFDAATNSFSYVVSDRAGAAAIVDPVLDFDPAAGRVSHGSADRILECLSARNLAAQWILETHIHADHLSAAQYLKSETSAKVGAGAGVTTVQKIFAPIFGAESAFRPDGSQFDHLFTDDECFTIGGLQARAMATPGHTPACVTFVMGDAAFVGDTLFMSDFGTARCDFPGGDARALFRSIQKIFSLPDATRLFMCHDYLTGGRAEYCSQTSVAAAKKSNKHVRDGIGEEDFVAMREARDRELCTPKLLLAAVQVNMRAGALPPAENGAHFLKIPINAF